MWNFFIAVTSNSMIVAGVISSVYARNLLTRANLLLAHSFSTFVKQISSCSRILWWKFTTLSRLSTYSHWHSLVSVMLLVAQGQLLSWTITPLWSTVALPFVRKDSSEWPTLKIKLWTHSSERVLGSGCDSCSRGFYCSWSVVVCFSADSMSDMHCVCSNSNFILYASSVVSISIVPLSPIS